MRARLPVSAQAMEVNLAVMVVPETDDPTPAVVLASPVHGVDADIRAIADEFAAHGFIAAAPDLFWRSVDKLTPAVLVATPNSAISRRSQQRLGATATYASCGKVNLPPSSIAGVDKVTILDATDEMIA